MRDENHLIVITSLGRAGSSMIAGMLHKAGIPVGQALIGPHQYNNATGHFEDQEWHYMNRWIAAHFVKDQRLDHEIYGQYPVLRNDRAGDHWMLECYRRMVQRHRRSPIWCRKCMLFGVIWPFVGDIIRDEASQVRIVCVLRDVDAINQSRSKHTDISVRDAVALTDAIAGYNDTFISTTNNRVYTALYEAFLDDPVNETDKLFRFVVGDNDLSALDIDAAVAHIRPELNHYGS